MTVNDKEREAEAELVESLATLATEQPTETPEATEEVAEVPAEAAAESPKPKKGKPKGPAKPKKQAKPAKPVTKPVKKPAKTATAKQADDRDRFNFRVGSKRSTAATMYSTGKGATLAEVRLKTGSVMLNMLKELMAKGYEVKKSKETSGAGKKQVTRYYLVPNLKLVKKPKKAKEAAETPQEVAEEAKVAAE
jgi:hypothetical protein